MKRTWLSLLYEAGYLLVAGVFLPAAADTAFNLLFSNTSYGDELPRLMGTVLLSTGIPDAVHDRHPYSEKRQMTVSEVIGGSPYGASTIAGGDGSRLPSENELAIARFQG